MQAFSNLKNALNEFKIHFLENELLSKHTSFKIGGKAKFFIVPSNETELIKTIELCKNNDIRYYILGKGSNILFSDDGFNGAIIHVSNAFSKIEINGDEITAYAGTNLSELCKKAKDNNLSGLEFAYGIPGNVGGAVYMNAGAYDGEIKDVLTQVTFIDENLQIKTLQLNDLDLGYRTSIFERKDWCIIKAKFKLSTAIKEEINAKMQKFANSRIEKQPLDLPSAGSAFKRPEGAFAGALIDECGLRGYTIGGAAISQKHCGFIVNIGNATCNDVLTLADEVCKIVKEKTNFVLEKEIRVVK